MAATGAPLTFGDTGRIVRHPDRDAIRERGGNGKLTNAEGKTGENKWGMRSSCAITRDAEWAKGRAGHFQRSRQSAACWHSRYGLMAPTLRRGHSVSRQSRAKRIHKAAQRRAPEAATDSSSTQATPRKARWRKRPSSEEELRNKPKYHPSLSRCHRRA